MVGIIPHKILQNSTESQTLNYNSQQTESIHVYCTGSVKNNLYNVFSTRFEKEGIFNSSKRSSIPSFLYLPHGHYHAFLLSLFLLIFHHNMISDITTSIIST